MTKARVEEAAGAAGSSIDGPQPSPPLTEGQGLGPVQLGLTAAPVPRVTRPRMTVTVL